MDPVTAGLFVAASFASSIMANKNQAKIEGASINMQTEQARLQIAEQSYEKAKQLKQNLSANLALSGLGVGGVSGFRGIASQTISDYFADQAALGKQDLFAQLSGNVAKATSKSNKFVNNAQAGLNAAQLSQQLGLFQVKGKK